MTPGESSTDQSPSAIVNVEADVVTSDVARASTGARLGWWRTLLGAAAVLLGVRYIAWQISISPGTPLATVFIACEALALATFLLTFSALLDRGTRAGPGTPTGSLDVFITVCGEPLDVVEVAIRTAMAIDYPHRTVVLNDGLIAGKPGWQEIDRLAERLGATVVTRTGGHRSKAGNLNHALETSTADFVVTIDADHRVDSDLAARLLRWFGDPGVGFVSAAQRFDAGRDVLNNRERFFFDWIQPAKDAAGCAISCGSGVAYRRRALDDIGGFSEWNVVEDLHTSYRLHAAGWTSVYERDAVTTGLAPQTVGEYGAQRARWALDSVRMLFFDNPLRCHGLRARRRLHYLQTTVSYLLAVPQVLFVVAAPLYLGLRIPAAGGSTFGEYLARAGPYLGVLIAFFVAMLGGRDTLAAFRSTVFGSPIVVVAIGRALAGVRRGGVTLKAGQRRLSWHIGGQIILVVALLSSLVVVLFDSRPGASVVAVAWAAFNTYLLIGPLSAVSERETSVRRYGRIGQSSVALLGVVSIAAAAVAVNPSSLPVADPRSGSAADFTVTDRSTVTTIRTPTPTVAAVPETVPPGAALMTAPTTEAPGAPALITAPTTAAPTGPRGLVAPESGTYVGISAEGAQSVADGVVRWSETHAGARPAIVNWFQHWGSHENRFREDWVRNVASQGAIPMITWEPWAKPEGKYADPEQPDFRLELIIDGTYDEYITAWAAAAAAYGDPILLRFMHEFNGTWYPWSAGQQGQTDEDYVAAWRHVHGIFERAGATNVSWVWSIVDDFRDPRPAYPGDDVVDWVGTTTLNSAWSDFGGWFDYAFLTRNVYGALASYGKPIMLSELGTNIDADGDVGAWYAGMFDTIEASQPLIGAIIVFDMPYDDRTDYRLNDVSSGVLADGMRRAWFAPPIAVAPTS